MLVLKALPTFCLHHFNKKNDFSTQFSAVPYDRLAWCLGLFVHTHTCATPSVQRDTRSWALGCHGENPICSHCRSCHEHCQLWLLLHSDMASPSKTPFGLSSLKNIEINSGCTATNKGTFWRQKGCHFTRVFTDSPLELCEAPNLEVFNPKRKWGHLSILCSFKTLAPFHSLPNLAALCRLLHFLPADQDWVKDCFLFSQSSEATRVSPTRKRENSRLSLGLLGLVWIQAAWTSQFADLRAFIQQVHSDLGGEVNYKSTRSSLILWYFYWLVSKDWRCKLCSLKCPHEIVRSSVSR